MSNVKILMLLLSLFIIINITSLVLAEDYCANTINEGKSCISQSSVSPASCYKGSCLTTSEINYKTTLEDCKSRNSRGLCIDVQAVKIKDEVRSSVNPNYISEPALYSCKPKAVGATCTAAKCDPQQLANGLAGCINSASCVASKDGSGKTIIDPKLGTITVCRYAPAPDKDGDGKALCEIAQYMNGQIINCNTDSPGSTLGKEGCSSDSCPWDCDDNDPYDSVIKISDIEKIEVTLDREYIINTIKERNFRPKLPLTPFDNFNIVANVKKKCGIKSTTQMPILPISLITSDTTGKEVFIASGSLNPVDLTTYQWKIFGWPNGITSDLTLLETLIDSISKKRKIFVRIMNPSENNVKKELQVSMKNCLQLYGAGEHRVIIMRGPSKWLSALEIKEIANNIRINGFEKTAPFNQNLYLSKFSFLVDLADYDDAILERSMSISPYGVSSLSSCKYDKAVYTYARGNPYSQIILPNTAAFNKNIILDLFSFQKYPTTIIHEFGHAFSKLSDEYFSETSGIPIYFERNCDTNAKKFSGYGTAVRGCSYANTPDGKTIYRSSKQSIMNDHKLSSRFNVISCGYILKEIDKINQKDIQTYWQECMSLDTIKPV